MRAPPPSPLRALAFALLGALAFAWIAAAALAPAPPAIDLLLRGAVHEWSSPPLTAAMRCITFLGSGWLLWPCGVLVCAGLVWARRRREAALFGLTVLGGDLLNEWLKLLCHRPRPEPFFGYAKPGNFSFPSGHAVVSFCFFVTLARLVSESGASPARRRTAWILALLLTLSIGLSRVYLGVHYPTDVAAGYAGAIVWTGLVRAAGGRARAES